MILQNWGLLEADFLRCYGVKDLLAAIDEMSWSLFMSLVAGLPPDAAFWRAFRRPRVASDAGTLLRFIGE